MNIFYKIKHDKSKSEKETRPKDKNKKELQKKLKGKMHYLSGLVTALALSLYRSTQWSVFRPPYSPGLLAQTPNNLPNQIQGNPRRLSPPHSLIRRRWAAAAAAERS